MDIRKPPSEQEVADWLKEGRIGLPPMRFRLRKIQPSYKQILWDFEIEGKWTGKDVLFVVEYKSLSTPKSFEEVLRQCLDRERPSGRLPLVLLPYLRQSQLDRLEQLGISGIDLCGNGVVIVPESICIFRSGQPNRFSLTTPIKNIYRKNTSMVARLFTTKPVFPNVRTICDEVNLLNPLVQFDNRTPMRLSTVSKALKRLEEDLIVDRANEIRLLQAEKLLEQLVENYESPTPIRTKRLKVQQTGEKLWQTVSERLEGITTPFTATGLSSVGKYAVMAREETIALYCSRLDVIKERLKGTETDRFPNVELIETDEEPLYFDARTESGFVWASPLQTYLELMKGDKRDQETADQVKALLLRTMK